MCKMSENKIAERSNACGGARNTSYVAPSAGDRELNSPGLLGAGWGNEAVHA